VVAYHEAAINRAVVLYYAEQPRGSVHPLNASTSNEIDAALVAGADGAPDKCRSEKPNAISHFHVDLERIGPRKPVQEGAAKRFADGLASLPGLWSDDMDDPPAMEPIVGGPT